MSPLFGPNGNPLLAYLSAPNVIGVVTLEKQVQFAVFIQPSTDAVKCGSTTGWTELLVHVGGNLHASMAPKNKCFDLFDPDSVHGK